MEFKKIFGWLLLFMGLAIMFYGIYASFNIFTAKNTAPEIFVSATAGEQILPQENAEAKGISLPFIGEIPTRESAQIDMQEIMGEQMKSIMPANSLPLLFNLMAWSIFAGISIFGGAQIAGLGIKLLK